MIRDGRRLDVARRTLDPVDVLVQGDVEGGRVTTVDLERVRAMAETAVERLRGATAPARRVAEQLEPALVGACRALAAAPHPVERRRFAGGR